MMTVHPSIYRVGAVDMDCLSIRIESRNMGESYFRRQYQRMHSVRTSLIIFDYPECKLAVVPLKGFECILFRPSPKSVHPHHKGRCSGS